MILHTKSIARILGHLMIITGLAMTVPLILAAIGGNPQIIPHLGRVFIMALNGDDRNGHTILLTFLDRITELPHHVVAGALEITDVIRVMDDTHLVRLIVPDREKCLGIYHNKNVL